MDDRVSPAVAKPLASDAAVPAPPAPVPVTPARRRVWLIAGTAALVIGAGAGATAYGLLISVFSKTQIAALFGTAILTILPATQFAGMLSPVSSNSGGGALMGALFPMTYYLPVTLGTFTKSLGFTVLAPTMLMLALFIPALLGLSMVLLRNQER